MKALRWFYILNKRLYKKAAFVAIMALILLSTIVFAFSSKQESGFIRVALAQSNKSDKISTEIINGLKNGKSMILFTLFDTPDQAVEAVKSGQADSAWIFPEDMGSLSDYETLTKKGAIRVVERGQNVYSRLARERLNSEVYKQTAKAHFLYYAAENLPETDSLSESEKLYFFENTVVDDTLFVFDNPVSSSNAGDNDYLTSPLKGLLALLTLLGGMAAVLYYMRDEERRIFENIPQKRKPLLALASVFAATINVAAISFIALIASGLYKLTITELLAVPLYALAAASFCLVLYRIFGSIKLFGAVIPAVITAVSCISPVFFYIREFKVISPIFPPTYYINVSVNALNLLYMVLYSAVCLTAFYLLGLIRKRA